MIKKLLMEVRELLSAHKHISWAGWAKWMLYMGIDDEANGSVILPRQVVERWKGQMGKSFNQLSEKEKQSDRNEVDAFMDEFLFQLKQRGLKMVIQEIK